MKRIARYRTRIRPNVIYWLFLPLLILFSIGSADAATVVVSAGSDPQVNGDNLQTAINSSQCGDTLVLLAGATYATRVTSTNSYGPHGYSFMLPKKNCAGGQYVTIQTSGVANLPSGRRVSYADIPNMATLASNSDAPVISYAGSAGWYKWVGILFTNTANVSANNGFGPVLVDTAQGGDYGLSWPHDITYDRVVIRPYEESLNPIPNTVRSAGFGIRLDGANMTIQNSMVAGFCCHQANDPTGPAAQSEAIAIVSGPGPYTITNNLLEAWGWNIFTGGGAGIPQNSATLSAATYTSATLSNVANLHVGDAIRFKYVAGFANSSGCNGGTTFYGSAIVDSISGTTITWHWLSPATPATAPDVPGEAAWNGVNPSNFTVTGNTLNKRSEWVGLTQCKSFWEMKSGSNVLFEGNRLTGPVDTVANPPGACAINTAFATNQDGSNPWALSNDNTFRNNLLLGLGSIFSLTYNMYCPSAPSATNITFSNNLLGYVGSGTGRYAFFLNSANGSNWTITHNTVRGNTNSIFHPNCAPGICDVSNVTFRDNIVDSGGYWIQTLDQSPSSYPGMVQDHNVIINDMGNTPPAYASTDYVVGGAPAIGFVNLMSADAGGDYHGYALSSTSAYKGRGSDGTDPGVNFETLDAALGSGGSVTLQAPANLTVQ